MSIETRSPIPLVRTARIGWPLWLALLAALAVSGFLLSSRRMEGPGFPLDDAWIHQTYARSLAQSGQWAYWPGESSAGSTAPLWSLLLAGGYGLKLNPLAWAYLLGGAGLFLLALTGEGFFRQVTGLKLAVPWAGLFLAGEWHLVWAAASGMETVLYAALVMAVLLVCARLAGRPADARGWLWAGLLVGLGVWVRPDALTLLGPCGLTLLLAARDWRARLSAAGWLAVGFAVLFGAYLFFNVQIQGSVWPNTFYAKQAEYGQLLRQPLVQRYFNQLKLPLIGSGLFLLPGFAWILWLAWRRRLWAALGAGVWFLGFAALYALRLPVTYQYGRYLMPAMPVFFVLGLAGLMDLFRRAGAGRAAWMLTRFWAFSLTAVWLAFYGLVAGSYARDVAIIETEMVAAARWVAANTPPDALIAAHDIGALGYFGQRRLIDLAGLISPEVIPFMRDEVALARWLDERQVDYLVTFPGWYADLPRGRPVVFQSGAPYSPEAGGENMWIYRWRP